MISMSALLVVIGVLTLVGTHLFVIHRWLREEEPPRPVPAPIPREVVPATCLRNDTRAVA